MSGIFTRRGPHVVLLIIAVSIGVAALAVRHIKAEVEMHVASMLKQTLMFTQESLERWKKEQRQDIRPWSRSDELMTNVSALLQSPRGQKALAAHPAQQRLRHLLQLEMNQHDYLGFFVIAPDTVSIASMRDANLGSVNLLQKSGDFLDRVFAGETLISRPQASDVPLPDEQGRMIDGLPTLFVASPVYDASGKVMAVLAFRIRSGGDYAHIVTMGRGGRSLESYLFDAQGYMLTPSRFERQLWQAGLLKYGQSSVLNIRVRDPGVNLNESGGLPESDDQWPLTHMADEAVQGHGGINLSGYRDYRGVSVVGAWLWDEREGYGLAAEMDVEEAYGLLNTVRTIFVVVLVVLIGMFILMLFMLESLNRRAGRALQASEARFRQLFALSPDAIGVHCDGRWLYVNPSAVEIFGAKSAEEMIGSPVLERVHPEERSRVSERISKQVKQEKIAPLLEERLLRMNGEIFWGEVQGVPFEDAGQAVVMVVMRDISRRKKLEEERERLRMAVEQTPEAIFIADETGKIVYANPAAAHITGIPLGKLHGMHAAEARGGRQGDSAYQEIITALNAGVSWQGEMTITRPDGSERIVERRISPVIQEGMTQYHVSVDRDITDERRLQEKMEHSQRLESLGVLAGGIAHDFNNILAAIMGNSSLAKKKFGGNQDAAKYLSRIEDSSNRAAELCRQMLAYSGKGHFVIRPVHLSLMLQEITKLLQVSIGKQVELRFDLAADLPTVKADATQLQQVIMNLVINASDAIADQSGVISLRTLVMDADTVMLEKSCTGEDLSPGPYVCLEVRDSGCGMSEETKKKLFDPFFTTKFTGRGLGMSAVLGIVRGHHGAIIVDSGEGEGTRFRVLLPPSDRVAERMVEEDDESIDWCPTGTVLVVDDEVVVRETAVMMLEDMGFRTLQAGDGEEAVEVYRRHRDSIALILLDMTMPRLDGLGCFRKLRDMDADVRVVLSSGYNEQDVTSAFGEDDLAGFVQKPYRMQTLRARMRGVLEG